MTLTSCEKYILREVICAARYNYEYIKVRARSVLNFIRGETVVTGTTCYENPTVSLKLNEYALFSIFARV